MNSRKGVDHQSKVVIPSQKQPVEKFDIRRERLDYYAPARDPPSNPRRRKAKSRGKRVFERDPVFKIIYTVGKFWNSVRPFLADESSSTVKRRNSTAEIIIIVYYIIISHTPNRLFV